MNNTMHIEEIPLENIFADSDFNCRGQIAPIDVIDLAKDIDARGLQFPVMIQPWTQENYKFRLIAGYRRFKAFQVLEKQTIPCIIRENVSDTQARILNLTENLKRKDLNMLQEANAIKKLRNAGMTMDEVSREVGLSRGWVQIRFNILDLPEEIQQEVAAGFLNQEQIKELHTLPRSKQLEAVKIVKEAKLRGEKKKINIKKPKQNLFKKKERKAQEIFDMMDTIQNAIGNGLYTRTLAWAAGEISDLELYRDIREIAENKGLRFEIPNSILEPLEV